MRQVLREARAQDKLNLETSLAHSVATGLPGNLAGMIAQTGNVEMVFEAWLHSAGKRWAIPFDLPHPPIKTLSEIYRAKLNRLLITAAKESGRISGSFGTASAMSNGTIAESCSSSGQS
jgi:hypothetical protein